MAKKITGIIRLQLPAGAANPAPPVGPALGAQGVNIMGFCKEFNAKTKDQAGMILPVVISVYQDRSFTFILKSPPAAVLLKKAAGIAKGSANPNRDKVGKVTRKQCAEIAARGQQAYDLRAPIEKIDIEFATETPRIVAVNIWCMGQQNQMFKIDLRTDEEKRRHEREELDEWRGQRR